MERAIVTRRERTRLYEFFDGAFHGARDVRDAARSVTVQTASGAATASGPLDADPERLTQEAVEALEVCPGRAVQLPRAGGAQPVPDDGAAQGVRPAQIMALARETIALAERLLPGALVEVIAWHRWLERDYANSWGVRHQDVSCTLRYLVEIRRDAPEDRYRTSRRFDHGVHGADRARLDGWVQDAAARATLVGWPSGSPPVLVPARALHHFLMGLWRALDADVMGRGLSPLHLHTSDEERPSFDPRLSIAIDPRLVGGAVFDDEGNAAQRTQLVQRGAVVGAFVDQATATAQGRVASGLVGATPGLRWNLDTVVLEVEGPALPDLAALGPRALLLEECREIARTTPATGRFGAGVEATLVEEGRIAGRLKGLRVSGALFELLQSGIVAAGPEGEDSPTLGVRAPGLVLEGAGMVIGGP